MTKIEELKREIKSQIATPKGLTQDEWLMVSKILKVHTGAAAYSEKIAVAVQINAIHKKINRTNITSKDLKNAVYTLIRT